MLPSWLTETSVIVGIVGLLGVLVGAFLRRKTEGEANDLAALDATVARLSSEVERLSAKVEKLEAKVETSEKRYRRLTEKYSAAIAYIQILWVRLGEYPPAPDLIAEDMTPVPE